MNQTASLLQSRANVSNFLIPTNAEFVEKVAKSISKDRLFRDSGEMFEDMVGYSLSDIPGIDEKFDEEFESLWASTDDDSEWNRQQFTADAVAAINKINLLLLTMP